MITRKRREEIALLREGGKRHAAILSALAALAKPGVRGIDLDREAARLIREGGDAAAFLGYQPDGADRPYPASICLSVNDEVVHGIPSERALQEGDIAAIDLGLNHKGFITDAAVTVPIGAVGSEALRLIAATEEALVAGIKAVRAGCRVGDIGAAIEAVAAAHGFALAEGLAGHGVGYAVHEDPYVPNTGIAGTGDVLPAGSVIAIEPMLTLGKGSVRLELDGYTFRTKDGSLAAHFEHTVLVTDGGCEVLTAPTR